MQCQDSVVMIFKYRKNGKIVEYTIENLPADLDSSYEFIDRTDKVVRKGNATPANCRFCFVYFEWNMIQQRRLLNSNDKYVMLFAKDFSTFDKWNND